MKTSSKNPNKKTTSTSETGHAKNLANFETLIIDCLSLGTSYNPSNTAIIILALQTIYTNATNALNDITLKANTLSHTINTREVLFIPLKPLATKIMAALTASGATPQTLLNAKTINRKIQGSRATKKTTPKIVLQTPPEEKTTTPVGPVTPVNISTAQLSFDNLVAHFQELVNYVSLYPAYNPNETNLKVTSLNTTAAAYTTANISVKSAQAALHTAMATRTNILYDPTTGMIQLAKEVKAYIKSTFGALSPEFKQINKIHFNTEVRTSHKKHHKKK